MLKLLVFTPCEKVIVGEDKVTSLISLLQGIELDLMDEIPKNATAPIKWVVFTLWHRSESVETTIRYKQRVEIISPDGALAAVSETMFDVSNQYTHYRNVGAFDLFPVGQEGELTLKLFLSKEGEKIQTEIADYPLHVKHKAKVGSDKNAAEQTKVERV